jgi:uncharacterized protein (TIGR00106 family)
MAILEISIVPVGTGSASVSEYVASALKLLENKRLKYELSSMGTVIEGELGELFNTAREMHESCFKDSVKRVVTTIKIDDRMDKPLSIESKKASVHKKMEGRHG